MSIFAFAFIIVFMFVFVFVFDLAFRVSAFSANYIQMFTQAERLPKTHLLRHN